MSSENRIDPICGMVGTIPAHGHYFCCEHCIEKYEQNDLSSRSSNREKLPAILLICILVAGGIFCLLQNQFMTYFMGIILIGLSVLKLWDWNGFSNAFQTYDILAKRSKLYSKAYPLLEMSIGIVLISQMFTRFAAMILAVVVFVSSVGVVQSIITKSEIKCACMGTKIKVPMTTLTLVENTIMFLMAISLLISSPFVIQ